MTTGAAPWRDQQVNAGDQAAAIETAEGFHRQLCSTRVLDPACGSGNFLYVALEHIKRLEGEVLETLQSLGETQQALEHTGLTVNPHQLLGVELNPRAAVIADLVLWIGYLLDWLSTVVLPHRGDAQPPIPVIRNFHNIVEAHALLTWKKRIPALDEGHHITQWDGISKKPYPTTGQEISNERNDERGSAILECVAGTASRTISLSGNEHLWHKGSTMSEGGSRSKAQAPQFQVPSQSVCRDRS